ncbi:MAG: fatty acid desaturase [Ilumatobacteraceae bacterium]
MAEITERIPVSPSGHDQHPEPTSGTSSPPALVDVIGIIPERCYRNPTAKGLVYAARDFFIYGLVVAALLVTDTWWILVPLWLVAGLAVSGLFVLGHDASHGALFRSRRLNRAIARVAMLPAAHFEEAWDLGHNRVHHGHTVKQGMDFVWHPITLAEFEEMPRWQRLRHKVEWSAIGAGFYYGRQVWWNKMMMFAAPEKWAKKIKRGRIEMLFTLVLAATAIGLVGWLRQDTFAGAAWVWVKVALVPWLLFIWIIGFSVYVHHIGEDIRWYPRRMWTKFRGQMEGTTILRTPRVLNIFFHHIFIHVPHHVDMRIPFYELPAAARAIMAAYPTVVRERRMSLRNYIRTTKHCKLYDFELGTWLPLPASTRPH